MPEFTVATIDVGPSTDATAIPVAVTEISSAWYPHMLISDGVSYVDVLGDGSTVDLQDSDGTVGTTKGLMLLGKDSNNKARFLGTTSQSGSAEAGVYDEESWSLLGDVLTELRKITLHMVMLTDLHIENGDL